MPTYQGCCHGGVHAEVKRRRRDWISSHGVDHKSEVGSHSAHALCPLTIEVRNDRLQADGVPRFVFALGDDVQNPLLDALKNISVFTG